MVKTGLYTLPKTDENNRFVKFILATNVIWMYKLQT